MLKRAFPTFFESLKGVVMKNFPWGFAPRPPHRLLGNAPGGALHIFWIRGRAIGKGIDFPDIGIKNGINFHNFGIRNGTDFQGFGMKYKVGYTFSKNWYKVGYTFFKNWYKERVYF